MNAVPGLVSYDLLIQISPHGTTPVIFPTMLLSKSRSNSYYTSTDVSDLINLEIIYFVFHYFEAVVMYIKT